MAKTFNFKVPEPTDVQVWDAPVPLTPQEEQSEIDNAFPSTIDIDALFGEVDKPVDMETLKDMAEEVAIMAGRIADLKAELYTLTVDSGPNKGTGKFDIASKALHLAMVSNHCEEGHKFKNGLFPKPFTKVDYFKRGDVDGADMLQWLRNNDLGDNIVETVPWNRLSSVLKSEVALGHEVPTEIFVKKETPTVRFGPSLKKFNAARRGL